MATTTQATTTSRTFGFETATLTPVHWVSMGLASITGIVHLYLWYNGGMNLFLLAGLGYFGAIALLLLNVYRPVLYLAGIPYTLAQIGGYVLQWQQAGFGIPPEGNLGLATKAVEIALIACLAYLFTRWYSARRTNAVTA